MVYDIVIHGHFPISHHWLKSDHPLRTAHKSDTITVNKLIPISIANQPQSNRCVLSFRRVAVLMTPGRL